MANNTALEPKLGFTDEESFGLFIEGLRCLQLYEDETVKDRPAKADLERTMQAALTCFRQCTSRYPDDLLSFFYLGVALSMKNQEVYVDRLVDLKAELTAYGYALAFDDEVKLLLIAATAEADQDKKKKLEAKKQFAEERGLEERAVAKPFLTMGDHRSWPLLEEAARLFGRLTGDPTPVQLQHVAAYNKAQVYARRGRDYLDEALSAIPTTLPTTESFNKRIADHESEYKTISQSRQPLLARITAKADQQRQQSLEKVRRKIHSCHEGIALNIQFDTLRASVQVRLAALKEHDKLLKCIESTTEVDKKITDAQLDPDFKADLRADFLTKTGYEKYEFADNRPLHDYISDHPKEMKPLDIRTAITARFFVDDAARDLMFALELKEHWNPAQIYLALIRRIQSGMAEARSELHKFDKDQALGKDMREKAEIQREIDGDLESLHQTSSQRPEALAARIGQNRKKVEEITAKLDKESGVFDRQIATSDRESRQFARDADDLFNALQGYSSTSSSTPATLLSAPATSPSSASQVSPSDSQNAAAS